MKKCSIILIFLLYSCSAYPEESTGHAFTGFYSSPKDIISKYGNQANNGYRENFLLGVSYKKLGQNKNAIFHFANSCFKQKITDDLKLYPYPVYKFISGFHIKSELYNDSVYNIADLFYGYREFEYVVKFTDLIKKNDTALFRDAVILKANALMEMKKYTEAVALLRGLASKFSDKNSSSLIRIRIASAFEKQDLANEAAGEYMKIISLDGKAWQSGIACRRIVELRKYNGIALNNQEKFITVKALYYSSNNACIEIFNELLDEESFADNADLKKFYIKALLQNGEYAEAANYIAAQKNDSLLHETLLKAEADELRSMNRKHSAYKIYKTLFKAKDEGIARESLGYSTEYLIANDLEYKESAEKYINDYPGNPSSEFFLRSLARDELKLNNLKKASEYMEKALSMFPDSPYSAWHRFWLFRICEKTGRQTEANNLFRDMIILNPDSSYTWKLLEANTAYSVDDLKRGFESAVDIRDEKNSLYYHTLLYALDKDMPERNNRIKKLEFVKSVAAIINLENRLSRPEFSKKFRRNLEILNTYFQTGYYEGINRELELFPDNGYNADRNKALFLYGSRYKNYYFSGASLSWLLAEEGINENIALLPEKFLSVLYPPAFKETVEAESSKYSIEKNLVYAVMKAESSFNHRAISPAGAAGLMQLMPPTANDMADQTGIKDFDLKDPKTSIRFGTRYLSWLAKFFKNDLGKMTAGYNAGAGNVRKWEQTLKSEDFGIDYFTEFIPFQETRNYILRTKEYYMQYNIIYSQ